MKKMQAEVYLRSVRVITAVRDMDTFTVGHAHKLAGLSRRVAHTAIDRLHEAGAIKLVGKRQVQGKGNLISHYTVCPNAISLLRKARGLVAEPVVNLGQIKESIRVLSTVETPAINVDEKQSKLNALPDSLKKNNDDFVCGMKVVKKANVNGMGNQSIKRLDQLLAGVRR